MIQYFATADLHISLPTSTLFEVFGFPITNSMLTGTLSLLLLLGVFWYVTSKLKRGHRNLLTGLVQWAYEGMLSQVYSVIPDRVLARKVAPLALTIFFYMLASYWMSVLPGLDTIKWNGAPVLRSITADMNFTFAVAIIVFFVVQYYAISTHGAFGNLKRYFRNPIKDPIGSFEGSLELIGEVSRYTALSLRMFGNCFAGEILLLIMVVLTGYLSVVTLPIFMIFELFIGFIQAYVFFILTVIFTSLAQDTHGDHDEHSHAVKPQLVPQQE